ncbi:MAG TPA: hypothetical protein VKD88_06550 [Gaiellaceae bacterium]|nr:hypothetical protein [Gaiellaceae bacterium]
MAWFGTRIYVGASWTVMAAVDGSVTWTEITATNPFPNTIAVFVSFRDTTGADAGFSATRSLPGFAQTTFLARNLTAPNSTTGWFTLLSFPTPIVPSALVYWLEAVRDHTEVFNVPIEQLDADGFPIGDAAAQPRPAVTETAQLDWHRPLPTQLLSADTSDEQDRALLEFLRAAQSPRGSLDAAEPFAYSAGLLLDEEAAEFRRSVGEAPER